MQALLLEDSLQMSKQETRGFNVKVTGLGSLCTHVSDTHRLGREYDILV